MASSGRGEGCFGGQKVVEPLPEEERLSGEPTGPPTCVHATDGEAALDGTRRPRGPGRTGPIG